MSSTRVGLNSAQMQGICSSLRAQAQKLESFVGDLDALEKDMQNYWEGDDLETFHTEFQRFKTQLDEMPRVVESIAKWGESTTEAYEEATSKSKNMFNEIFSS